MTELTDGVEGMIRQNMRQGERVQEVERLYDGYQFKPNFWKCESVKINSESRKSRKASSPILKLHRPILYIFVACI